jgi:hypothetical protein
MSYTLRQITDALWATGPKANDETERERLYGHGRMLRDKGLILSSRPQSQGKVTLFSEADTAAACVAICASANGMSWGIVLALNSELRAIGNTLGRPEFEASIEAIKAGIPVFARLDIVGRPSNFPVAYNHARMGSEADVSLSTLPPAEGTTQILFWPVTEIAKPVLDYLARQEVG